jgi:hypothetical protein
VSVFDVDEEVWVSDRRALVKKVGREELRRWLILLLVFSNTVWGAWLVLVVSGPRERLGVSVVVEVVVLETAEEVSSIYGEPAELCASRNGRSTFRCT